jgi:hypothetical protein
MKPGALRALAAEGYTINLRHLHERIPFLAALCRGIEQQTGHPAYVSGIITPPGGTGLRHHWDQFTAIVTQLAGRKRWPVWAPVVENPTGDHLSSPQVWTPELQHRLENTPPDLQYDLEPGDTLVLPRGWIHSPRSVATTTQTSYHLTFAVQERTWLWAMQQLLAPLIEDPRSPRGHPAHRPCRQSGGGGPHRPHAPPGGPGTAGSGQDQPPPAPRSAPPLLSGAGGRGSQRRRAAAIVSPGRAGYRLRGRVGT